jgi:hypothetical protein
VKRMNGSSSSIRSQQCSRKKQTSHQESARLRRMTWQLYSASHHDQRWDVDCHWEVQSPVRSGTGTDNLQQTCWSSLGVRICSARATALTGLCGSPLASFCSALSPAWGSAVNMLQLIRKSRSSFRHATEDLSCHQRKFLGGPLSPRRGGASQPQIFASGCNLLHLCARFNQVLRRRRGPCRAGMTATSQTLGWMVVFFVASPAASAA